MWTLRQARLELHARTLVPLAVVAALSLALSCGQYGKVPSGDAGGANVAAGGREDTSGSAGAGGTTGGASAACPDCPAAPDIEPCCQEYCGYLNLDTSECVPARAGSRILLLVTYPDAVLCAASQDCDQSPQCPEQLPEDGSSCRAEDLRCHYCRPRTIPRTVACLAGQWSSIGPHPPCGYVVDPPR